MAWSARRRVCIVTTEFHGLFKNGGIGTANTGLALALAEAGCTVTVLFANFPPPTDPELHRLRGHYSALGIDLEVLVEGPTLQKPYSDARTASYAVFLYLRAREFDVVYFHDNCGRGFYSLTAKHTGCFPDPPLMFVVAHGPHQWVYELNCVQYYDAALVSAYLERRSIELADALISPSQYLVDWMAERGWKFPSRVFVEQNIVRVEGAGLGVVEARAARPVEEIVFFGRNEVRKGVALFCDALDLMEAQGGLENLRITFLGKFGDVEAMHSAIYILERSARWTSPVRMQAKLDQTEALRYLAREGALAVIPSLAENSPCVVMECLQLGLPFIATSSGGTAELVDLADAARCLVAPDPTALALKLTEAAKKGHGGGRLAIPQAETERRWRAFHGLGEDGADLRRETTLAASSRADAPAQALPMVSICLALGTAPAGLEHRLEAILEQDYENLEVIVAIPEDGESETAALAREVLASASPVVRLRLIKAAGADIPRARDLAIHRARGAFVLVLDETNVTLAPDCVAVLVEAAMRTRASVVTGFPLRFEHDVRPRTGLDGVLYAFPIGACLERGIVENCFGDAVALIERKHLKALGPLAKLIGDQTGFWRLFAAAAVAGLAVEVAPTPVFWHRGCAAPGSPRSGLLEEYRALLDLYAPVTVGSVRHLFEKFLNARADNRVKLRHALDHRSSGARELALRMSNMDPNSKEAMEGFLQYAVETGRVPEALDFALCNETAGDGSIIRWTKRQSAIDFSWPLPCQWELELKIGRLMGIDQARRIEAFVGGEPLNVAPFVDDRGEVRLHILGPSGPADSPEVSVRILLPYAYRLAEPTQEAGLVIDKMIIRPADPEFLQAGAWRTAAEAVEEAPDIEPGPLQPEESPRRLTAVAGGAFASAESARLDQTYVGIGYRHLEISLFDVTFDGVAWPCLKFKVCETSGDRFLEFRHMREWPDVFTDFPGKERDAYGLLLHLLPADAASTASWTSERDRLLVQSVAALLPTAVDQVTKEGDFSDEDRQAWRDDAVALSTDYLAAMRELHLGVFAVADIEAGPLPLTAAAGGAFATAESARLDQTYVGNGYRHLDISLFDVTLDGVAWPCLKFKLCKTSRDRFLEFRQLPGWPDVFTDFPGEQRDAYGLLFRLSPADAAAVAGWASARDQLLVQSVAALLPRAVDKVTEEGDFSDEDREAWRGEAAALSADYLAAMRELHLGVFAGATAGAAV
jgi:glycosyltransferase involved in cell wall biosynthesis